MLTTLPKKWPEGSGEMMDHWVSFLPTLTAGTVLWVGSVGGEELGPSGEEP